MKKTEINEEKTKKILMILIIIILFIIIMLPYSGNKKTNDEMEIETETRTEEQINEDITDKDEKNDNQKADKENNNETQENNENLSLIVPDIDNMEIDDVFEWLNKYDIYTEIEYTYDDDLPDYCISSISLKKGEEIDPNYKVTVKINLNEKWAENEKQKEYEASRTYEMTNFLGMLKYDVEENLNTFRESVNDGSKTYKSIRFVHVFSDKYNKDEYLGKCIAQNIEPEINHKPEETDLIIYYLEGNLEDKEMLKNILIESGTYNDEEFELEYGDYILESVFTK